MLKKTMTFVDFDGEERTEDFYFHLTPAETVELEFSYQGGIVKVVEKAAAEQDAPRLIALFKQLVIAAYGEKSLDGKRFIKNDEVRAAFEQTTAYSDLFIELSQNAGAAAAFMNAVIAAPTKAKPAPQFPAGLVPAIPPTE